jgi:sulfite exporter TauE/SafE/copper chaperone CopZ
MTCPSCERRIERALKKAGASEVSASFSDSLVKVAWDPCIIDFETIRRTIEELDYRAADAGHEERVPGGVRDNVLRALFAASVIWVLYMLLSGLGLTDIFYSFPEASAGMGYGMLFVAGLLTSAHCVAMCGGINLSQSLSASSSGTGGGFGVLRSGILYNLGRVVSYTIIGGAAGTLGSAAEISSGTRGWIQLTAGAFMVIMGLVMLDVCPWLRSVVPRMPKALAGKIGSYSGRFRRVPLFVGLLNGLMPCGPLQAMQLYALSAGSFAKGALSMFIFSAGTVPLMFTLSALSSILSRKFTKGMMTAGAAMVVILGVVMFGSGMNMAGVSYALPGSAAAPGAAARMEGGVQVVSTELASGRYDPITVKAGAPVRWIIHAEPNALNGCNNRIVIPEYGRTQYRLQPGDNVIEFTPERSGAFLYTCWMGMIRGRITVLGESGGESGLAEETAPDIPADFYDSFADDSDPFDIFSVGDDSAL